MILRCLAGGALLLAATGLAAAPSDPRLVTTMFTEDKVVRIDSRPGVQTTVAFDADEHIENVAVGDSLQWQVTPNKRANLLFVKPLSSKARTNMTVVTDRHTYLFDLVASAAQPIYVLRFRYPEKPKAAPVAAEPTAAERAAIMTAAAEAAAPPRPMNQDWRVRGNARLLPTRVYDDGKETYLSWAADSTVPAILIKDEKGNEGPVNYSVRDGVIVVDGVPGIIVLRAGKEVASLEKGVPADVASVSQKKRASR